MSLAVGNSARSDMIVLSQQTHSSDGRVPFYRGELYINDSEVLQLNSFLANAECEFGVPFLIEVKSPPLVFPTISIVPSTSTGISLPSRSARLSVPIQIDTSSGTNQGGKSKGGKASRLQERDILKSQETGAIKSESKLSGAVEESSLGEVPSEIPMIPMNSGKVQQLIQDVFAVIAADGDYSCLFAEYLPQGGSGHFSLSSIKERVQSGTYSDHFIFFDDLIALSKYWLQGPPAPNPLLPQYIAALKLIRQSTDLMISRSQILSNEDYYTGPDVDASIKQEVKREQAAFSQSFSSRKSASSTSYARKVRRTDSSGSANAPSDLKSIEEQVTMLTQHVLGMQNSKGSKISSSSITGNQTSRSSSSSSLDTRPLSAEEIRRLEADLMKMSADDIDFLVSNMLKNEPSVRIDDESYELDVSALPGTKQRAIRRFVTRRLNLIDPSHEAQKLKQILKQDELAKASEEIAERILAGVSLPQSMPLREIPPVLSPEELEAERQRAEREKKREEEARRLWKLAHGGDEDDDGSEQMDVDQ